MILKSIINCFKNFHSNPAAKANKGNPGSCESAGACERKENPALGFTENGELDGSVFVAWYNLGKGGF